MLETVAFTEKMLDAGCSMLDKNKKHPYFIQHPEASIQHHVVTG